LTIEKKGSANMELESILERSDVPNDVKQLIEKILIDKELEKILLANISFVIFMAHKKLQVHSE
jgi:hypothetical protein